MKVLSKQYLLLNYIDEKRRIINRPGLSPQTNNIEEPCKKMVKQLITLGLKPFSSNAYGNGHKGIVFCHGNKKYFLRLDGKIYEIQKQIDGSHLRHELILRKLHICEIKGLGLHKIQWHIPSDELYSIVPQREFCDELKLDSMKNPLREGLKNDFPF